MEERQIIIFDGRCGLCYTLVRYIAKKDTRDHFLFYSHLSAKGQRILRRLELERLSAQTIILVNQEGYLVKSKAMIAIAKALPGLKRYIPFLGIMPICFLDIIYSAISKCRRVFFYTKTCSPLSASISHKVDR